MKPLEDQWGHDPSVRKMRQIFRGMEASQGVFLERLNVPPLDRRLRRAREKALIWFEQSWAQASREAVVNSEEEILSLYIHCLAKALEQEGLEVPEGALPAGERVARFLKKGLP